MADTQTESISVREVFTRAVSSALEASNLPLAANGLQELYQSALADLRLLISRISALGLFSPNETLEDISTYDLIFLAVHYVYAEVKLNVRVTDRDERQSNLQEAQVHLHNFVRLLDTYEIIPPAERKLFETGATSVSDPSKRRELKIAQYKKEKEIKSKVEGICSQTGSRQPDSSEPLDLVASLLSLSSSRGDSNADEDLIREAFLLSLRLQWTQTSNHLESVGQELELLKNASREDERKLTNHQSDRDSTWTLDMPDQRGLANLRGPVLDPSGKPLRPFTILPSNLSERARLQAEVFRPDHRLPTMSIDEYLEEERRRGNIISGGGPESASRLTRSEQLALDSEMDGSLEGEARAEEKRIEDEQWAQFTDVNPKGAGNTMNRG